MLQKCSPPPPLLSDRFNVEGGVRIREGWCIAAWLPFKALRLSHSALCCIIYCKSNDCSRDSHKMHVGKGQLRFPLLTPPLHRSVWKAAGMLCNAHVHVGGAEFILLMYTSREKPLNGKNSGSAWLSAQFEAVYASIRNDSGKYDLQVFIIARFKENK